MTRIDWEYPEPRCGLAGEWDRFIGPGATRAEAVLILGAALLSGAAMLVYGLRGDLGWTGLQVALAVLIAADLGGGVVANASRATKRWYHRPGQKWWQHVLFAAAHVYPLLIAWLYREDGWMWGFTIYQAMLLAVLLILSAPLYLRRPLAFGLTMALILVDVYAFGPTPGFEWLVPALGLKLLAGHILREEPYAPPGG